MRRLVLQMQMSVDGYVAAADPDLVWQVWDWGDHWIWDDQLADDFNAVFRSIDCILLSRKIAQEGFLDHWTAAAKKFPLELLSRKADNFLNSSFCNTPAVAALEDTGLLEIAPADARARIGQLVLPGLGQQEIVERLETELSSSEIFAALFELELAGKVRQMPGKNFVKSF